MRPQNLLISLEFGTEACDLFAMPSSSENSESLTVSETEAGQRLDKVMAAALPAISRSRLKALVTSGHVRLTRDDDEKCVEDASFKVRAGDLISLEIPPPLAAEPQGQDIPLTIVYEDDHLIVINKPAGLVVHPAAGNYDGTLVNALIAHCGDSLSGIGGVKRPGIVHRIDKDTSGLLVVAKTDAAHAGLSEQFAEHSLERIYLAVVWGCPIPPIGTIEGNLGRSPVNRLKMAIQKSGGKHAVTHYKVIARFGPPKAPYASLVECRLETGRTHQIRVHMMHIGHPLIGDPAYGRQGRQGKAVPEAARLAAEAFKRQALHASVIGFEHPLTHDFLKFESPLPSDIEQLIKNLE
jgi:23S rRNA pseudouridine1911/1915/1917 synthase